MSAGLSAAKNLQSRFSTVQFDRTNGPTNGPQRPSALHLHRLSFRTQPDRMRRKRSLKKRSSKSSEGSMGLL
eukprot:scaffold1178_cov252-Pinguiococcus_pyrenoidosus.AAC.5